jgi:hypothetical protein
VRGGRRRVREAGREAARERRLRERAEVTPEHLAESLRERVYGGVACLSTLLVLVNHLDADTSAWSACVDVLVAAVGLWVAGLFADLVANLAAHGRLVLAEARLAVRASGQVLQAATVPVVLLVLSGLGVLRLRAALVAGVWVSVVSLGLFALLAARRTDLAWWKQALLVASLVAFGALVTLVKILAHG